MNLKKSIFLSCVFIFILGIFVIVMTRLHVYQKHADLALDQLIVSSHQGAANNDSSGAHGIDADNLSQKDSGDLATSTITRKKNLNINSAELKKASPNSFIVAFFGDQGLADDARNVLKLVKKESADVAVILGDYDYADNPKAWMSMLDDELGRTFPIIPVIGNHDEKEWNGYAREIATHLARTPSVVCDGKTAIKSTCSFRNLRMFVVAPGIDSLKIPSNEYADFIRTSGSRRPDSYWNFCAWHKNQKLMQLGGKPDETGWDTYNACLDLGFPIMTAHEHSYSRSFLMTDLDSQVVAPKATVTLAASSSVVVDNMHVSPGHTFVAVSGLGGHSIRPQILDNPWWSSVYTSNQGAKQGALFCAFNYKGDEHKALCYFKNIDGEVIDVFMVER